MPRIHLFKDEEIDAFDSPPLLSDKERKALFTLHEIKENRIRFRKKIAKLGFILQMGYFKYGKKFYTPEQFRKEDIKYVTTLLGLKKKPEISEYKSSTYAEHRPKILGVLAHFPFNENALMFENEARALVRTSLRPKDIFHSLIDFLDERRIERPKYYLFAEAIRNSLNSFENELADQLEGLLDVKQKETLDNLMKLVSGTETPGPKNPYLITKLKKPNQELKVNKIRESLEDFAIIKDLHSDFIHSVENLGISNELLNYYAVWVIKAEHIQFESISKNIMKRLYLIAFIVYQFRIRQDVFVDTMLQCVQKYLNDTEKRISKDFLKQESKGVKGRRPNFTGLKNIILSSKQQINEAKSILYSNGYDETKKVELLKQLIPIKAKSLQDELLSEIERIHSLSIKGLRDRMYYGQLSEGYLRIRNRVGGILLALEFNVETSDGPIMEAIADYQRRNGKFTVKSPMGFISDKERNWVLATSGTDRANLYRVILFKEVCNHIKAGSLNLKHSEKYRSIDEYFIDTKTWQQDKNTFLARANLEHLKDFGSFLESSKLELENQYAKTNENAKTDKNLKIGKDGRPRVVTPKSKKIESEGCLKIIGQDNYLPLINILTDVGRSSDIARAFSHFSRKSTTKELSENILYAGIMGLGCNIGVRKMGKISKGVGPDRLDYAVRWYFSKQNIDEANRRVLALTEKLSLPKVFTEDSAKLHSSSDGQKYGVSVPSLHARHSYKYFGLGKGVSAYSFIDDRNRLFYNTVISASEREAGYVLDGLMHNDDIESDVHSTDTHGYSEIVFGLCNSLGVFFAPRIKNYKNQLLYTFKKNSRKQYQKMDFMILPSKSCLVQENLLGSQWENILRLLCTIKLKQAKASDILSRLSSYSKQHPLYRALKELGRISKTIFILRYLTETPLRQSIEKQLNKVELSHRFAKAVFFGENQEFKVSTKDEQEIALSCRHLIQNAIILWNYMSVSQTLSTTTDEGEYNRILDLLKGSSIMTWQHINMLGEYNFEIKGRKLPFDMQKILDLKISA